MTPKQCASSLNDNVTASGLADGALAPPGDYCAVALWPVVTNAGTPAAPASHSKQNVKQRHASDRSRGAAASEVLPMTALWGFLNRARTVLDSLVTLHSSLRGANATKQSRP